MGYPEREINHPCPRPTMRFNAYLTILDASKVTKIKSRDLN